MSHSSHSHSDNPPAPEPEEDKLPYGRLVVVGLMALAAFAVGGLWSTYILYRPSRTLIPDVTGPMPPQVGQAEIGIVDQKLFAHELRAEEKRQIQLQRLNGYGWTNRDAGIIHIPINQAMDELAAGAGR
jgi:hypothetical protein